VAPEYTFSIPYFFANADAFLLSLEATAYTTVSGWFEAGDIRAMGPMFAAPRMPNFKGEMVAGEAGWFKAWKQL
jgi:hypothetical protein